MLQHGMTAGPGHSSGTSRSPPLLRHVYVLLGTPEKPNKRRCPRCSVVMSMTAAALGMLPGIAYLMVFTLPHSLWVKSTFLPVENVPNFLREPGLELFNWFCNQTDDGTLNVNSTRLETTESVISSLADLLHSYGMGPSDLWYQEILPLSSVAVFAVDVYVTVGVFCSMLLVLSYWNSRSEARRARWLAAPMMLYNLMGGAVNVFCFTFLIYNHSSVLGQPLITSHGIEVYQWLLALMGAATLFNMVGFVLVAVYIAGLRRKEKMQPSSKVSVEGSGSPHKLDFRGAEEAPIAVPYTSL